jgi:hypothetical protein
LLGVAGLALPDDQDGPAAGAEGGRIFSVAGFVGEAFGVPEGGVGLRLDAAVFAGVQVPEAAVDEDDLFEAGKILDVPLLFDDNVKNS